MDCGQGNLACDIQQWLTIAIAWLAEGIRYAIDQFNLLVDWIKSQLKELIAIVSLAFAVWKWWHYRESVLHRRLAEYLAEQDRRLTVARDDVLQAIFRPGRRRAFSEPLFAAKSLRSVLRRRRWDSSFDFRRIEKSAERNLDKALGEIERRLGIAVSALTSLRAQMASAYMLKGAIAAAYASQLRSGPQQVDIDDRALIEFRTVLQVHDYERDAQAKEYEAHQLRKLGHLAESDAAYEQLEALTAWISNEQTRHFTLARARRYRAQIAQVRAIAARAVGMQATSRSPAANSLMNGEGGALAVRALHAPFRGWEAIEQGEMHYVSAFICCHLEAVLQEPLQLSLAETMFRQVLSQTPSKWFMSSHAKRLREAAEAGLLRVQRAQAERNYDDEWLLPPSHQPQGPSANVSGAGGN